MPRIAGLVSGPLVRISWPLTAPTRGSANGPTSARSVPASNRCRASARTTISLRQRGTSSLITAALPRRVLKAVILTPAPSKTRARATVGEERADRGFRL